MPKTDQYPAYLAPSLFRIVYAQPYTYKITSDLRTRLTLFCLCVGSPLLVCLDWLFDYELINLPFAKYIRAFLLVVFVIFIVRTGSSLRAQAFSFGWVLGYFAALNLLYTVFSEDIIGNLYYTSRILFWILGSVVAYRLVLTGALTEKLLLGTIGSTVFLGAAFTISYMLQPDTKAGQNASAYLLLWCLPLLVMVKKSLVVNIFMAISAMAILLTVKRGAMIALGLSIVAYALTYQKIQGNIRASKKILGLLIILVIVSYLTLSYRWEAVANRFEDTTGAGRDQVYTMIFEHWLKAEPKNLIFGFGINSVQQYTGYMYLSESGIFAHSDWLQYMHDFGIMGIIFLVWLHFQFLTLIRDGYRLRHSYTPSLVMGYVILFLVNIYSGHLMSPEAIYLGFLLAFSAGTLQSERYQSPIMQLRKRF